MKRVANAYNGFDRQTNCRPIPTSNSNISDAPSDKMIAKYYNFR